MAALIDRRIDIIAGSDAPVEAGDPESSSMLLLRELGWMGHPVPVGTRSMPLIDWTRYEC